MKTETFPFDQDTLFSIDPITDEEFLLIRNLIHQRLGIFLTEHKRSLLVTRLNTHIKKRGFCSFREYYDSVLNDKTGEALGFLADQISTNHTFFFREVEHFHFFQDQVLPNLNQNAELQRNRDLRVWCAAASTGEEPYSLAMSIKEFFGSNYSQWKAGLLATDISREALETAEQGVYSDDGVARVPADWRYRYLVKQTNGFWKVKPEIQKEVLFRRFNLMNKQFPFKKQFHVIFCRNVMIYFDQPTIQDLVDRLFKWTVPGGYLFVGHSESLGRIKNPYNFLQPAVYQKPLI